LAPENIVTVDCNCSICTMKGYLHLIVPARNFKLLQGADSLSLYTFNTHTAKHYFCKVCGISSYYIPRSNPDGYDVNLRCIEPGTIKNFKVDPFDGKNWEKYASSLSHLSV